MAHSTDYYVTGGGILYIKKVDDEAYVDVGNCPSLTVKPEVEMLEHVSNRGGRGTTDKKVTQKIKVMLNFKLDELSVDNLSMFMLGTAATDTVVLANAVTEEYSVKFVSDYEAGDNATWEFPRVEISPSDAMELINTGKWAEMGFSGEVLDDTENTPSTPFGTYVRSTE
jgi:hypothetical protein